MPKRIVPTSIKDYISSLSGVKDVFEFIRTEVMDVHSKSHIRKMMVFNLCVIILQASVPAVIGMIFSGLAHRLERTIVLGILSMAGLMFVQKICEGAMYKSREWVLNDHWGNLDRRMTELFLEKSPGQHIQETALNVSSIEKGRGNLMIIQGLIFFDLIPVLTQLAISLILITCLSIVSGGLMMLAMCLYVTYSVVLNFQVMKVCTPIDKSMRQIHRRRSERMEKAIRVIVSSQTKREVSELTEWFDREVIKDTNFWLWFIGQSTWRSFINVSLFLVIVSYGSWLVWIGKWEVGLLLSLIMWGTRIIENIWQLGSIEQKINWGLPSVKAMINALTIKPDVVDVENALWLDRHVSQRIVIENISHFYPAEINNQLESDEEDDDEEKKDVESEEVPHTLKKVSFTIEPGEKVALLGPSGAGKTTVMRLLLRFMDPNIGAITVNGHNLRDVARESWLQSIGYIPQHAQVFDGTVRENLTYQLSDIDRAHISDSDLWELMRRLEIDFGTRLDKGLDTKVGKHGLKLSGGQAQRLMIGAAVIGNPWFMVIDEATSSLDSTTERKVQKGLTEILSGNTSALIVAHRLSTVRKLCTKFVVLRPATDVVNGDSQVEAVASSFEELYKISPTFRELADDQGIVLSNHLAV